RASRADLPRTTPPRRGDVAGPCPDPGRYREKTHTRERYAMVDILHRIGVRSSPEKVYDALTTVDGLAGWWTEDTDGDGAVGGVLRFRFAQGGFDMKVLEQRPGALVRWEVVDGPPEWIGTQIRFDLARTDGFTIVLFRH